MQKAEANEFVYLPLFKDLNSSTIESLSKIAYKSNLSRGKMLFCEKDKVNRIYLVLKGKVTMYRTTEEGQKRVIYILNEGELINEVVFDDLPASVSCEAFEDCVILSFDKDELLKVMAQDFKFTKAVLDSMGRKVRRLYRQLKNAIAIKIDKKLAAKLWKLSNDYGVKTEEGILIDLNISVTYLADMLGSSRETISRCLKSFEEEGLIRHKEKKIMVISKEKMSVYFRGV